MENGRIALARASGSTEISANAQLIAAMNPCPCGKGTSSKSSCFCSPGEARRYVSRVSGPVADRFGLHIEMENCENESLFSDFRDILTDFESKVECFDAKVHINEKN